MFSFHNESEFLDHWKFPALFHSELVHAEKNWASDGSLPPCAALGGLPLEIFAALTLGVPDSMPFTQRRLPSMAPDQGQGQSRVLSHFPSGGVRRHESLMQT